MRFLLVANISSAAFVESEVDLDIFSQVYQEEFSKQRKEDIFFGTLVSRFFKSRENFTVYLSELLHTAPVAIQKPPSVPTFDAEIETYKSYISSYQLTQFQIEKQKESRKFTQLQDRQQEIREKAV